MRSRRLGIHVGGPDSSIAKAELHILLHDISIINFYLSQIFNIDTFVRALLKFHLSLDIFAQEIMNFFIIDLNKTAPY